jgi:hypothetical protein
LTLSLAASGFASDLDDRLNQSLRGAWAVLEVEVYSGCAGTYSDNTVGDAGVASKAPQRFEAGELVKIDKVNAKRQRVDLLVSLAAPVRISRVDGPFELFDEKECKVQLIVPVAREDIKSSNDAAIMSRLGNLLTLYPSLDEALRRAISDAADVAGDLGDDSDYLAGFAAGAEEMSSFNTTDCGSLIGASLSFHDTSPPKDKPNRWRDGWEDGQELIFNVLLAEGLEACHVPVPSAP